MRIMENRLCMLIAILSLFVICLVSADETPQQGDSALDLKKSVVSGNQNDARGKGKQRYEDEDEEVDDSHSSRSSFVNRYLSYNPPESNHRTRSRWPDSSASVLPSTYDDFVDGNDWSTYGYGEEVLPVPLPSMSHENRRMSHNGPACNSLIDPQYPIFSDTCGAVPQARYALPNSFGHRERWQIAHILNALMISTTEPTCTRSIRLLLCPILFPPCPTRHQSPPVLPCQSYCRAIKSRCASPILDSLPCELLPYSSDLCPTNQPYGSFASQGGFPSNMQSSPMTGAGYPPSRPFPSLQSLLSSSALQAALSSQGFPAGLASQNLQAALSNQNFQSGLMPPNLQSGLSAQSFQSGLMPQNLHSALSAQNFQSGLMPQQLQAALSAQGFQSGMTPQNFRPETTPAPAPPPPTPAPAPAPSAQAMTSPLSLYNSGQYGTDNLASMLASLPSRLYSNDYQQPFNYGPFTRSSTETRPSNELRSSIETRSSAGARSGSEARSSNAARSSGSSSMVKA